MSHKRTLRRTRQSRIELLAAEEVGQLERMRADRRWSYRELAENMSAFLGVRMPEPTLVQALRLGSGLPTTILPIRKYLGHLTASETAR